MQNLSNENEFDLHENGPHSHINGFEQRLVLTQKQKASWKWPTLTLLSISESFSCNHKTYCKEVMIKNHFGIF